MRPVLFTALAASALVASVAIAQTPPPPPDGGPPPPPPREMEAGRGPGGFMPGFMRGHRPPMPPPPKAAVFRFRIGDRSVFVKCAEDEPTKACTDAVAAMMQSINPAQPTR